MALGGHRASYARCKSSIALAQLKLRLGLDGARNLSARACRTCSIFSVKTCQPGIQQLRSSNSGVDGRDYTGHRKAPREFELEGLAAVVLLSAALVVIDRLHHGVAVGAPQNYLHGMTLAPLQPRKLLGGANRSCLIGTWRRVSGAMKSPPMPAMTDDFENERINGRLDGIDRGVCHCGKDGL